MSARRVTHLFVYPVKSLGGASLAEATVGPRGLLHDREWMVVDADGQFITQREVHALARVATALTDDALTLSHPTLGSVTVPRARWSGGPRVTVRVWKDDCLAVDQGDDVAAWLSAVVSAPARLVRMDDAHHRPSKRVRDGESVGVGFCDGYPLLFATRESLDDLNARLASPMEMLRFRPNVVVEGCEAPWEEDRWGAFTIGAVGFEAVKPCVRCVITTLDPVTGESTGREPLATLAKMHRGEGAALFGMNVNHYGRGVIRVGDALDGLTIGAPVSL